MPDDTEAVRGCWVAYAYDWNPYLIAAYPTEIEALREINGLGYGSVMFLPWGMSLVDAEVESKKARA